MKLAIIPGDGIGPEVSPKRSRCSTRCYPAWRRRITTWAPSDSTRRAKCCPSRRWPNCGSTTPSCWAQSVTRRCPAGCWSEVCCYGCDLSSTTTSTCGRAGCTPACSSPLAGNPDIDFVVIREGTEGPYTGTGGAIRVGTPHEVATEVSINTAFGVRRVVEDAFARAQQRRKHLTLVHKTNVLTFAGSLWSRTVEEVGEKYPDCRGRLSARRRRDHPPGHRSRALRCDRHRQPLRRHHHRPGRRRVRRYRVGGQRKHRRHPDQPVDVRTGARQRARHRRAGDRRSRPPRLCRWRCCFPTSAKTLPPREWTGPWRPIWPVARAKGYPPPKSAKGLRPRSSLQPGRQRPGRHDRHRQQREQPAHTRTPGG